MSFISWMSRKFEDGIFDVVLRRASRLWCLSIGHHVKSFVKHRANVHGKAPAWVSEAYQLLWFVAAVALLALPHSLLSGLLAGYRVLEIIGFAAGWAFDPVSTVHSFRRSLAGFLVNYVELVVCFAVLYLALGIIPEDNKRDVGPRTVAVYTSVRMAATIGPSVFEPDPPTWKAATVCTAQVLCTLFLTVVVVSNVVGRIQKGEPESSKSLP